MGIGRKSPAVALSGTGTAPNLQVDALTLDFGNQPVGTAAASKTVKVTNNGTAPARISLAGPFGANPGDFAIQSTCGPDLPPGQSCKTAITFKPGAAGARKASITINHDAGGTPYVITLGGTGVPAASTFSQGVVAQPRADLSVSWQNLNSSA